MSFTSLLNTNFDLEAKTETPSVTDGSIGVSWSKVVTAQPCRLTGADGKATQVENGSYVIATHKLFCDFSIATVPLEKTHRVVIGSNVYDILLVKNAGGAGHHYELLLQRIY